MGDRTDEKLMAYVDGELGPKDRLMVEAELARNPQLRADLEVFRSTRAALEAIYDGPSKEPPPAWLVDMVLNYNVDAPARQAQSRRYKLSKLLERLTEVLPQSQLQWRLAGSAAILIVGVGIGWTAGRTFMQPGPASSIVTIDNGRLVAAGEFNTVLEGAPSMEEMWIGGSGRDAIIARVTLTYKAKHASYCREFEVASGSEKELGVACRTNSGKWAIQAYVPTKGAIQSKDTLKPALRVGESIIDTIFDKTSDGDALGSKEEAAAIKRGWR
ncbi:MAG TPA: hypothetical protein VE986_03025 [Hyphomicrobiales bacterium]|nr:hypothetical protein [Hyphomicrobiales bacterium]